jgi:hypothetical protein
MEDSHIASLDLGNGISFFGVYDGHGGMTHYTNPFRKRGCGIRERPSS